MAEAHSTHLSATLDLISISVNINILLVVVTSGVPVIVAIFFFFFINCWNLRHCSILRSWSLEIKMHSSSDLSLHNGAKCVSHTKAEPHCAVSGLHGLWVCWMKGFSELKVSSPHDDKYLSKKTINTGIFMNHKVKQIFAPCQTEIFWI